LIASAPVAIKRRRTGRLAAQQSARNGAPRCNPEHFFANFERAWRPQQCSSEAET
jgi:hypothetical protein